MTAKFCDILLLVIVSIVVSLRSTVMLQLNSYNPFGNTKFFKKMVSREWILLAIVVMLAPLFSILYKVSVGSKINIIAIVLTILFYLTISILRIISYLHSKSKLVFTNRAKRLIVINTTIIFLIHTLFAFVITNRSVLIAIQILLIGLTSIITMLASLIVYPFEQKNNARYVKKATQKLAKSENLIKIGITGSFGKTSCKHILNNILSSKFKVLMTEGNYNTPLGIAKTTNKLLPEHQVFIAEMGARHLNDIKELCEIVKPKYAIITGVNNQHLETFKTIENIAQEKYQLINSLPTNGYAVFNGDNDYGFDMFEKCIVDKSKVSLMECKRCVVSASDIKLSINNTKFKILYNNESYDCETKLLGRHNITNILLATALALKLGLDINEIIASISNIPQIAHRLEIVNTPRGINIIDDSYNQNFDGAMSSYELLSFAKGRKVVLTQGIVELGQDTFKINKSLGKQLSKVADLVLAVGVNAPVIIIGLQENGFDENRIMSFPSLKLAQDSFNILLNSGDTLLIQNDLPDNF